MQSGDAVDGVSLAATPTATRDSILLTLRNESAQPVGYNLCSSAVERRAGTDWQNQPTDRVCTMELRTLSAGEQATFTTTLPAGATPGDYRFVARVAIPLNGELRTVASNTVSVR